MNWLELWHVAPGDVIGLHDHHPSVVTVEDVTFDRGPGTYVLHWQRDGERGRISMMDRTLVDLISVPPGDRSREMLLHAGLAQHPSSKQDITSGSPGTRDRRPALARHPRTAQASQERRRSTEPPKRSRDASRARRSPGRDDLAR